jgi:hypothetical protein
MGVTALTSRAEVYGLVRIQEVARLFEMSEDDPISVYLMPNSGSLMRDLVKEVNFEHAVKGKVTSMIVVRDEGTGFPTRLRLQISYSEIPYPGTNEYSNFERDMETRLQQNMDNLIAVPVDISFRRREPGEADDDQEEEDEEKRLGPTS